MRMEKPRRTMKRVENGDRRMAKRVKKQARERVKRQ
jgi:hypothetical protein